MSDREKVIQELESMRNYHRGIGNNITADIAEDALALLQEQEDMGKELTDAMELIHKKNERIEKLEKLLKEQNQRIWELLCEQDKLKDMLKEQEAVVRCKNCKYYTPNVFENKGNSYGECHKLAIGLGVYCVGDWFCADGERRTDDARP